MIKLDALSFSYTHQPFIEGMNLHIMPGEIFGLLGPSGAGKSTLQKILIGLLPGYRGSAIVNGVQVRDHHQSFYEDIGVMFEYPTVYANYTARQNLEFFASLYAREHEDIAGLLEQVGLANDANKRAGSFSKGMKSRLCFLKAIVHKPKLLFLDEPTSGLDPNNAHIIKEMIRTQRDAGTTIVITTHQMHDAAELCDRVAFLVDGEIKALDRPAALMHQAGSCEVTYTYHNHGEAITTTSKLDRLSDDHHLQAAIGENRLLSIHSQEPNLGDVFMSVTGRRLT